jgi:hypothetical protein
MKIKTVMLSLLVAGSFISTAAFAARQCPNPGDIAHPVANGVNRGVEDPCERNPPQPGNGGTSNSNEDACGAVLCLAGAAMSGKAPTSCDKYIRKYFEQQVFSSGSFDPSKTFKARRKFLDQCKSSNDKTRGDVNNKYGKSSGI